jgi:hypothetical protein
VTGRSLKQARAAGYAGRFIVFAGALGGDDREAYEALGVDYVIDKPAQNGELMSAVREIDAAIART